MAASLVVWHTRIFPFLIVVQLTSTVSIIVPNAFLHYKITLLNRKAKENERLGNEEDEKKFKRLHQELQSQVKATITLFLVCGIDVVANILLPVTYLCSILCYSRASLNLCFSIFNISTRSWCFTIPSSTIWLIHEEDTKKTTKLVYSL